MAILGAHQSVAGGYHNAVRIAAECGCDCVQLFTKNNNQWNAKPIASADSDSFRGELKRLEIGWPLSHASYLINLASPDEELRQKSVAAFVVELERAEILGIPWVVVHPGASRDSSEEEGIAKIVRSLDEIDARTPNLKAGCLLETTAGQGTCLGRTFEHLAAMIAGVKSPDRLGVCFDTCHVFAAGYPLIAEEDYQKTMAAFDKIVGLERLKAFHLNDSLKDQGSRVDRHAHIGRGKLGFDPFRWLLNDDRFEQIPMYLETPKGESDNGEKWDVVNLRALRELCRG